jgi:hypothetical protein
MPPPSPRCHFRDLLHLFDGTLDPDPMYNYYPADSIQQQNIYIKGIKL